MSNERQQQGHSLVHEDFDVQKLWFFRKKKKKKKLE